VNRARGAALLLALLVWGASCSDDEPGVWTTSTIGSPTSAVPAATAPTVTAPVPTVTTTTVADVTSTSSPPGAAIGLGDPYFPDLGNPGYDVEHYLVELAVDPVANTLAGRVVITAAATADLDALRLDLLGLTVDRTVVDGTDAPSTRQGPKLVIDPAGVIPAGETFTVAVGYHGTPATLNTLGFPLGWVQVDGLTYVVAEPDGARTWLPCNDHPADKAAFTFRITAPEGQTVAANGSLVEVLPGPDGNTFVWDMPQPMATYLATVLVGDLARVEWGTAAGVLVRDYLPADLADDPPSPLPRVGEMVEFFVDLLGPYPFAEYGHAVVPGLRGALENQTLCVFGREALLTIFDSPPRGPGSEAVVAHELAHQWFGNSVTPATWQDIWLNEGFATFAQWLWVEHDRGAAAYRREVAGSHAWLATGAHPLPGDPGSSGEEMFHHSVYLRGGLTLAALRVEVGDETTRQILRTWAARFAYGNATTADFIALAEELSGHDLDSLFRAWLLEPTLPPLPG